MKKAFSLLDEKLTRHGILYPIVQEKSVSSVNKL